MEQGFFLSLSFFLPCSDKRVRLFGVFYPLSLSFLFFFLPCSDKRPLLPDNHLTNKRNNKTPPSELQTCTRPNHAAPHNTTATVTSARVTSERDNTQGWGVGRDVEGSTGRQGGPGAEGGRGTSVLYLAMILPLLVSAQPVTLKQFDWTAQS